MKMNKYKNEISLCYKINYIKTILFVNNIINAYWSKQTISRTKNIKISNINLLDRKVLGNLDLNCLVLVPFKLSVELCLTSGSWLPVTFFSCDDHLLKTSRWAKVVIDYDLISNEYCCISSQLHCNIRRILGNSSFRVKFDKSKSYSDVYLNVRLYSLQKPHLEECLKKYTKSNVPAFAKEVKVALVSLCEAKCSDLLEKLLHCHFSTPKYVQEGDYLFINFQNNIGLKFKEECFKYCDTLQFVVLSIQGSKSYCIDGWLVSADKSTLFLSEIEDNPSRNIKINTNINHEIPPCLGGTLIQIQTIFHLFHAKPICCERNSDISKSSSAMSIPRYFGGHLILIGPPGSGMKETILHLSNLVFYSVKFINCLFLVGDSSAVTATRITNFLNTISDCSIIVFENISILSKDKDGNEDPRAIKAFEVMIESLSKKEDMFIMATDENKTNISDDLWNLFSYHLTLSSPTLKERKATLQWLIELYLTNIGLSLREYKSDKLSHLLDVTGNRTTGFYYKELENLVTSALRNFQERKLSCQENLIPILPSETDFTEALDEIQQMRNEFLNLPSIPCVRWEDIGGLGDAKKELIDAIQLPLKFPNLLPKGSRRSGILLYGPPGTGKTFLGKAVASECGLNFLSVKGPELINMYIGQSEQNVREVFSKARTASPCIVFFDEVDSLAPKRGRAGDSGGVMDRLVSALLAELDNAFSSSDVFLMAATNRPDLLDPMLLRPGRFERQIYIGPPESVEQRIELLRAVVNKISLDESADLKTVAEILPPNLTGADFSALATDAFYIALKRAINGVASEAEATVLVTERDLMEAAQSIKPSVSSLDLKMYLRMKSKKKRQTKRGCQ